MHRKVMSNENSHQECVIHIYQRSHGGFILFYTATDFLVFFSIVCTVARKYGITVLGICPMYDHVHILIAYTDRRRLSAFVQEYSSIYAKSLNENLHTNGQVFKKAFGRAYKSGYKKIRTACSYVYNNPVEKGLCKRAENYRWTFLAFAISDTPFSTPIAARQQSRKMYRATQFVKYHRGNDHHLKHKWLTPIMRTLSKEEQNQLADFIISRYNAIDYSKLLSYYGDYKITCLAFASNQGSEYDIREEQTKDLHTAYNEIASELVKNEGFKDVKDSVRLTIEKRLKLIYRLYFRTSASMRQVEKYLRFRPCNQADFAKEEYSIA